MQTRILGKSGLEIVPVVLGGNVFGWTVEEKTSLDLLDAWVDRGFDAIDTADVYSAWVPGHKGGESETIIGNWLRRSGKRNRVKIFTKVGMGMPDGGKGLRKAHIVRSVEDSLQRLRTDVIDLYQSHKDDEDTPLEETLGAYQELIEAGKVRAVGASNYTGARLAAALELAEDNTLPSYTTLQPEYNLYDRKGYEHDLAPVAKKFGLGVVPYFSLASGFLTGKYQSLADTKGKKRGSRVEKYFDDRGVRILKTLRAVSEEAGVAQASVALAWMLAQPTITAPIASATSVEQMGALFAAAELQLSEVQVASLTQASAY